MSSTLVTAKSDPGISVGKIFDHRMRLFTGARSHVQGFQTKAKS